MSTDTPTSFVDGLTHQTSKIAGELSENATEIQSKVSEYGRQASGAIDQKLDSAASGLDRAAATLHGRADNLPSVAALSSLAHSTADKLSATAGYVREHDVTRVASDFKMLVKNNPGPSLLVAGVAGFLVGRAFRSGHRG